MKDVKMAKGELTRQTIVDSARLLFNELGLTITLDVLAREMGVTKGRITNHFSTKEKLFLAILQDYEDSLQRLIAQDKYHSPRLQDFTDVLSDIMDLQFEYRCSIIFLNLSSPAPEMREHISATARQRIGTLRERIKLMVTSKILLPGILEGDSFKAFLFIYVNQLTQWVLYHDMYAPDVEVKDVKHIYLRGIIFHGFYAYLTGKGRREFDALHFRNG